MKLKLKAKADKSLKDALIIHVEYNEGAQQDREGNKIPKKKLIQKVNIGETIEVDSKAGYAILAEYGDMFELVEQEAKKPAAQTAAK